MDAQTARRGCSTNPIFAKAADTLYENLSTQSRPGRYVVFGGAAHSGNYPSNKGINALLGIPSIRPYTTADQDYYASKYQANPSRLSINEINVMKMPEGAVAPNPSQNASDFVFRSR